MMRQVIGIFSRESDRSFNFLSDALWAKDSVREVRSFTITNTNHRNLREEASRCDCAILYHSKNRGRLNITDVIDSLYDEEITDLCSELGRENVIVVADDLEDSSSEMRTRILQDQPLIQEMAAHLFLISKEEKNSLKLLHEKLQVITSGISRKASRTTGGNQSASTLVEAVKIICSVPGQVIVIVMSVVLFFYNMAVFWVMMPVNVIQAVCDCWIHCVTIMWRPVRVLYNAITSPPGTLRNTGQ